MTTEAMDCGDVRVCLGVYVLGSIDPAERSVVDAHLSACRDCRDELAGLAGIPALLSRVSVPEAVALAYDGPAEGEPRLESVPGLGEEPEPLPSLHTEPPKELLGAVLDLTAARRRRRQWRLAGLSAAAAVMLAAGAFAGTEALAGGSGAAPPTAEANLGYGLNYGAALSSWATARGSTQGMVGTVTYRTMGWGTQAGAKVVGIPVGTYCTLVAVGKDGSRTTIGGWTTDTREGTIWYPASSGLPSTQLREFQITVAGHGSISIPVLHSRV